MEDFNTLSIILASGAVAVPVLGLVHRIVTKKGIGWQFIRFNVIAMSSLVIALLALNKLLSSEAIAGLIGAALGYAFARTSDGRGNNA